MLKVNDLAITSIETITAFDIVTGDYKFTLDELQNFTLAQSQEKADVTGKQGRKVSRLQKNKAVTLSGNNGLVSGGLLELQTGGKFERKETEVLWTDYLTVTDNSATTQFKAVGTIGNEIESVYIKNEDGTLGDVLEQDATEGEGKFAYDPGSRKITFNAEDVPDNTEIVVYYKRKITADVLDNLSDTYSGKCALYVDVFAEDKCARVYRVQIYIPKADFNGEFSLEMGENQTVHSFDAEALSGACGAAGTYWTYTVFGADVEDAE